MERFGPSNVLAGRFRPAPKLSHPPIRLAYPEDVLQPIGPRRIDVAMDTVTPLRLAFERRFELFLESLPVLVVIAGLGGSAQVRQVRADRHGDPLQPAAASQCGGTFQQHNKWSGFPYVPKGQI